MGKILTLTMVASVALTASLLLMPTRAYAHTCEVNGQTVELNGIQPSNYPERVTFCHGTGSSSNPYVLITTDLSGACGHYKEHVAERPPRTQNPDVFPDDFLARVGTLCAGRL